MKTPGFGLRIASSVVLGVVLGLITLALGITAFIMGLGGVINETLTGPYLLLCFFLGPVLMRLIHQFYHQFKVIYIILLVIRISAILLGAAAGLMFYDLFNSIDVSDVPVPRQEGALLGNLAALLLTASATLILTVGVLCTLSGALGLKAFGVRTRSMTPV